MIYAQKLPTQYNDKPFHTDFREWIRFELLMCDKDLREEIKIPVALQMIFCEFPQDINEATEFMLWFYRGSKDVKESKNGKGKDKEVYSFVHDDEYIYAAFMQCYGIDLLTIPYMHWWQFRALFRALHDCKFTDIMGYRATETKDMSDSMKRFYSDMQKAYKLPLYLSEQYMVDKFKKMRG